MLGNDSTVLTFFPFLLEQLKPWKLNSLYSVKLPSSRSSQLKPLFCLSEQTLSLISGVKKKSLVFHHWRSQHRL